MEGIIRYFVPGIACPAAMAGMSGFGVEADLRKIFFKNLFLFIFRSPAGPRYHHDNSQTNQPRAC